MTTPPHPILWPDDWHELRAIDHAISRHARRRVGARLRALEYAMTDREAYPPRTLLAPLTPDDWRDMPETERRAYLLARVRGEEAARRAVVLDEHLHHPALSRARRARACRSRHALAEQSQEAA